MQGQRGAQGAGAARRRLRHGPRRRRLVLDPVPERQQLGARHRRVHAGRASTTPSGVSRPSPPARCCARVRARDLWRQIAQAAWECADPGLQFDTTINKWHTAHTTGRINGSNPCSEYMHLDNSACNLASINLLKYLDDDDTFDVDAYMHTIEMVFTAQEILVGRADYPTPPIGETSRKFRQLGLGYANLGALLMALGHAYDSAEGRAWAAALTSLMTGHAYAASARTASRLGPFDGFADNEEHMLRVLRMHRDASYQIDNDPSRPGRTARRRPGGVGARRPRRRGVRRAQQPGDACSRPRARSA